MPFMPWQQMVADVALEIDAKTGLFAYREVGLTVPRQSGKSSLILAVIFARALAEGRQQVRYTAQTGSDARKKLVDDWLPVVENSPFFKRGLFRTRLTNGHEALKFRNGSHVGLVATTKKSGHGGTIDLAFLDEAFAHPDARLEQALRPAMITRTFPGSQLWVVSTAGTPEGSPYLWDKVEKYREVASAGLNHSVCYFEYSADEDLDPSAEDTWWSCMPALGFTQTVDAVRGEFEGMALNEFERAYLNRWKTASSDPVIPLSVWKDLADPNSYAVDPVVFAFDVTPDQQYASVAVCGRREDGRFHVEVVDQRQGTDWVASRIGGLVRDHNPLAVVCDPGGTAGAQLPKLANEGVDVVGVSAREHAQAYGLFIEGVGNGDVRHLGSLELVSALDGALRRPLGEAWGWARKSSAVDISPLVAVTLALWGFQTQAADVPQVWDLNEVVEQLRRERANETPSDLAPDASGALSQPVGGTRFIPLDQMPSRGRY